MISISEKIDDLPSKAILFALDGIKNQQKRKDFKFDLETYGKHEKGEVCYGCVATCAIQEIAGKSLTGSHVISPYRRSAQLGFDQEELERFEGAIDSARRGYLSSLFRFCKASPRETAIFSEEFSRLLTHKCPDKCSSDLDQAIWTLEYAFEYLEAINM